MLGGMVMLVGLRVSQAAGRVTLFSGESKK